MRRYRLGIILSVTLLFLGCTATNFSSLQNDYYELVDKKHQLKSQQQEERLLGRISETERTTSVPELAVGLNAEEQEFYRNPEQLNTALLSLAEEAEKLAGEAKDPRTRIAILRLAGLAAWQSGRIGYDKALKISLEGQEACRSLPKEMFGAPRDCALLLGVAVLAQWDILIEDIKRLRNKRDTTGQLPAEYVSEVEKIKQALDSSWKYLDQTVGELDKFTGLDQSVRDFYQRQRFRSYCNYYGFTLLARSLRASPDITQDVKKSFCAIRNELVQDGQVGLCWSRGDLSGQFCGN